MKKYISLILILLLFSLNAFGQIVVDKYALTNVQNVKESGARGNGISDDTIAFIAAIGKAGNNILFVPKGTYIITSDVTAGSTVTMFFSDGVTLNIANTKTFTIQGKLVTPYLPTITGTGTFTYSAATIPIASVGGLYSASQGDMLYASAANTWAKLSKDTNATRYLSNTGTNNNPAWAQVALTTGISGVLPMANGGSAKALTVSNGGVVWTDTDSMEVLAGTSTANQALLSGSTATPAWSTATYPATTTINQLLYSGTANAISGLTTGNSGVLVTSSGGVPSIATDIPTAVTIGIKYIYRAEGTDVPVTDGGTGASDASTARTNLGLGTISVLASPLPTANGGVPATRTIDLYMMAYRPWADGANNSGILTDSHDNTNHRNYTDWTSGSVTQDYDIVYSIRIPTDFISFSANAFSVDIRTNDKTNNICTFSMYDNAGNVDAGISAASGLGGLTNNVWGTYLDTPTATYVAGQTVHLHIHMGNNAISDTVDVARAFLTYNTR